jgi:hypothetical protein
MKYALIAVFLNLFILPVAIPAAEQGWDDWETISLESAKCSVEARSLWLKNAITGDTYVDHMEVRVVNNDDKTHDVYVKVSSGSKTKRFRDKYLSPGHAEFITTFKGPGGKLSTGEISVDTFDVD